ARLLLVVADEAKVAHHDLGAGLGDIDIEDVAAVFSAHGRHPAARAATVWKPPPEQQWEARGHVPVIGRHRVTVARRRRCHPGLPAFNALRSSACSSLTGVYLLSVTELIASRVAANTCSGPSRSRIPNRPSTGSNAGCTADSIVQRPRRRRCSMTPSSVSSP